METKPISDPSWASRLRQTLSRLREGTASRQPDGLPRLAIVGIGHELRGDDAAGVMVARGLAEVLTGRSPSTESRPRPALCPSDGLLVVDAGPAPENCTGLLRRFDPDLVLLVDAAQMGVASGEIRWLTWGEVAGPSTSTHSLSIHLLTGYLAAELGCEVALIGIQPANDTFGAPLSPAVRQAVDAVVKGVMETWKFVRIDAGHTSVYDKCREGAR